MKLKRWHLVFTMFFLFVCFQAGCQSPAEYRVETDKAAYDIIKSKQQEGLGKVEGFDIERPGDILRRRLMEAQGLAYSGPESLGSDKLEEIEYWPEEDYPKAELSFDPVVLLEEGEAVQLSLLEALQVGARNSFEYQDRKEEVFRAALTLELERDFFRNTFLGQASNLVSTDTTGDRTVSGTVTSGDVQVTRLLKSGAELSGALAIDLANLLTMGGASSVGIAGDATIAVPLLSGAGRHIVTEPLTQAERNVVYAVWEFERFKKRYAVDVASNYLSVLRQLDALKNTEEDYRSRISSARRSRRLADAGRLQEIEVDQAVQNELRARQRWVSATEQYKRQLDSFKNLLGLPTDARIELDLNDLERLTAPSFEIIEQIAREEETKEDVNTPAADAAIVLVEPSREDAGPLEMEVLDATYLALGNRLDLRAAQGKVYDAQRAVVVAADALGAELTLFGSAALGEGRSVSTADEDDAQLRFDKGFYSSVLTLDLPFERTAEAVNYRNSFIDLEEAVRGVQVLEDDIKLQIRNELRDMLEARENLYIQAQSVFVAQKRVKSVNLFLEAGRAQIRDLLEAQDALLSAQNSLTSAVVDYRIAELRIQRDMGLLMVDEKGLWQEYSPEKENDA